MLKSYHKHIYFFGLILLVISLPLSIFLLSVAQFILILNWLLENNFREKFSIAKRKVSVSAFVIIYFIHILGMIYSTDITYGLHDLRIKLPLLLLPIIIGTTSPVSSRRFDYILFTFCGAVLISTFISAGKLFGLWGTPISDVRDISIFISHIRLALMINLAIFILVREVSKNRSIVINSGLLLCIVWFILFLIILKSLTGIIILLIVLLFFGIQWVTAQNLMVKWFVAVTAISAFLIATAYITNSISQFNYVEKTDIDNLDTKTSKGNLYTHNITSKDVENGNFTWLYVCDEELEPAWNNRSSLKYWGKDLKGQDLRHTIIRYLTSKGLRKDAEGLATLNEADIKNIEMGMANHIYSWKFSLYPRIYQLMWEINNYKNGGNPSGHSLTQRIEYLKTSVNIIKSNFWIGVGTGNVAKAFEEQYVKDKSQLDIRWRLRAHNQFITFLLTFGLIGFSVLLVAFLYPFLKEKGWTNYYSMLFVIIGFLSFLNEDTLETHTGVSFFAFFYAFFLFNAKSKND